MEKQSFFIKNSINIIFILFIAVIIATQFYSYILFHSLVEIFSIIIAGAIFLISWNAKKYIENKYFIFLGISFLFVSIIDIVHLLAYKGMGVFLEYGSNLPTQLWIAGRYLQALSLLVATFYVNKKFRPSLVFLIYTAILIAIGLSIFYWNIFPACYIDGVGQTMFKIVSEYVISAILLVSIYFLWRKKEFFSKNIFDLIVGFTFLNILAEQSFAHYVSVYGFFNLLGHVFKLVAFYLIYKALVELALVEPYSIFLKGVKDTEQITKTFINASTEELFLIDTKGKILMANQGLASRIKIKVKDLIGKNMYDLLPKKTATHRREYVEKAIYTKKPVSMEDERGGMVFEHSIFPVLDENKKVIKLAIFAKDITAQRKAEKNLKTQLEATEQVNKVMVGREQEMIKLKEEINDLMEQQGKPKKYLK